MAKRRKEKDEEDDKPFKMPKFDEEAFIKKEKRNVRTSFIAFILGIVMAIICFGFYILMSKNDPRWLLVLVVALVSASFIKYLYEKLHIDLTDFTTKNWVTSFALYFFTWLLVFIILINPPFYDDEAPVLDVVTLPNVQEPGGTVKVCAKVTDNVGVVKDSLKLTVTDPDDNQVELEPLSFKYNDMVVIFEYNNSNNLDGTFDFEMVVRDVNGYTRSKTGDFKYDDDTIEVDPDETEDIQANDEIKIEVNPDINYQNFLVCYTLNGGERINVDRVDREEKEDYETSPKFEGWDRDTNYEFRAYAEIYHYFIDVPIEISNIVPDSEVITINTGNDSDIGEEDSPVRWDWTKSEKENLKNDLLNYDKHKSDEPTIAPIHLPTPRASQAPGFELIIFIAAIAAVFLIYRRKKNKDKRR